MNLGTDISCNVYKKLWSQIISNWIIRLRRGKLTFTKGKFCQEIDCYMILQINHN